MPDRGEASTLDGALLERIGAETVGLIVAQGSPLIDGQAMDALPALRFVGDVDGDRFADRVDVEAAWARGITTLDTTNGTSYPVAEWALAHMLIALRGAGGYFRQIIDHSQGPVTRRPDDELIGGRGLTGKSVGLIGCGHIGRRLLEFLQAFRCSVSVFTPYLPRELPEILGITRTSLENVLSSNDVVVCLAPLTPSTKGMLGAEQFELLPPGCVFVNVSRGAICDSDALVARLERGDIVAGLDVYDPEPFPKDSPIVDLPNVFLSPHIAHIDDGYPEMFKIMVDEAERILGGDEPYFELSPRSLANRRGTDASKL